MKYNLLNSIIRFPLNKFPAREGKEKSDDRLKNTLAQNNNSLIQLYMWNNVLLAIIKFSGRSANLIRETWSLSGHDLMCRRVWHEGITLLVHRQQGHKKHRTNFSNKKSISCSKKYRTKCTTHHQATRQNPSISNKVHGWTTRPEN